MIIRGQDYCRLEKRKDVFEIYKKIRTYRGDGLVSLKQLNAHPALYVCFCYCVVGNLNFLWESHKNTQSVILIIGFRSQFRKIQEKGNDIEHL
jgi:hypothetical protein